jgi:23S rRNA pseudouridine1911/1915/1917 synthase
LRLQEYQGERSTVDGELFVIMGVGPLEMRAQKYTVNWIHRDKRFVAGFMQTLKHELTIPSELDGKRLDQALAELLPDYSRSRLKEWILAGHVSLAGSRPVPRTRVKSGQQVLLTAVLDIQQEAKPEPMDLAVVFEDDALIVIDKPAGLVVHPGAGNAAGTLMNGLLHHAPDLAVLPRSGILHRLDKDTSGLLLVAKTVPAHTRLVQDLQARAITREYRGLCSGRLTAGGRIDAPIGRHPTQRTRMAVTERGRPAVTHYRILARFAAQTFVALRLETGRTHFSRQALHASRLAFRHPSSEAPLDFQAPLPADFVELLQALQSDEQSNTEPVDPGRWDQMRWPEPEFS